MTRGSDFEIIPGDLSARPGELGNSPKSLNMPACGLIISENRAVVQPAVESPDTSSKFHLVIAGHSRWEGGGRSYFLGPDTLLHVPAGQKHRQSDLTEDPVTIYSVHYRTELLSPELNSQLHGLGILSLDLTKVNASQARVVRSIFQEMLFEQAARQESWEMILRSRLIDLAVRAIRLARRRGRNDLPAFDAGGESTERVARYALNLKSHFFDKETIADAAAAVGLKRRQFTSLFRKVTGQTWRQYTLGLRLNHATGLLAETALSVAAVAFESGFDDLSNFNHAFKAAQGCSPLAYRSQRQISLPDRAQAASRPGSARESCPGFKFRGIKGWFWTAEQYLEEIPVLADLRMNFLMNCYGSMMVSRAGRSYSNEWWKPMPEEKMEAYGKIIRACRDHGIEFCFALHSQLAATRPVDPASAADIDRFYQHFSWAQGQGVRWFSICLDGTRWDAGGPESAGASHTALVNAVFRRLRAADKDAQFVVCPAISWGDAANRDHRRYLGALAREMHPDVYVFWNGDGIRTPRVTRVAAEAFKKVVNHRLFLWDNYPVNDDCPTLHLGPVSGREAGLCEVIDGYLSNPMHSQNQINRIPLATCADYAFDPWNYNPARAIGQAIVRQGKSSEQQRVLEALVEIYPGFIVAGGASGTNPAREKFGRLVAERDSRAAAKKFIHHVEDVHTRLGMHFPKKFSAARKTVADDIQWMKRQTG